MAMAYAAEHPDRLAGLVLIGASAVPRGMGAAAYRGFASLVARIGPERMARLSDRVLGRMAGAEARATVLAGGVLRCDRRRLGRGDEGLPPERLRVAPCSW